MTFQAEELDTGKPAQDAVAAPKTTERKKKKTEEPSFEEALSRLEALVRRLEDGNTPLDESLRDYEEAIRLVRLCSQRLEQAEQAVRVLQ
jgi:exodeoxyribonuclease VII small subunit